MLFIVSLLIISILNTSLQITNDYIVANTILQSEMNSHDSPSEKTIYNLAFSAACLHNGDTINQFCNRLKKYGISTNGIINNGTETIVNFSDELSILIENFNSSKAYISIDYDKKKLSIPIEYRFSSNEEALSLLTRDFSSYDFNSNHTRSIISQEWGKYIIDGGLSDSNNLVDYLFQIFLQATSVYPGMSYEECMDMLQSPLSAFCFISKTDSEIWVYQALPRTDLELHFSYYFNNDKLSCMTVTFFPPNNASFAVELEHNKNIAPMFFIRIEDTWLTNYLLIS